MYLKRLLGLRNLTKIYNQLTYIDYNDFRELKLLLNNYVDFNKKFEINDVMYNSDYNAKIIQIFDNTRVNILQDSVFFCLNGSFICKDSNYNYKLITGDALIVDDKKSFKTIYNPYKSNSVCLLIEKDKQLPYFFR